MAAPRKYPDELRERATRMAVELRADPATKQGAIARVAEQLGMHPETLRNWVRQAEIDGGVRPGTTSAESERIAKLEQEVRLARQIQVALLPASLPQVPGWEMHGGTLPSRGVSGDFYKALIRGDGTSLALFVADVSGKGVAASLLTASLEALSALPLEGADSPERICEKVGKLLHQRTPPEKYATAFLGILEPETGRLRWTNAGHNPALLLRAAGEPEWLKANGTPLGLLPGAKYREGELTMEPGDALLVYTDGITEALDPDDEEFGETRLLEAAARHRALALREMAAGLERDLDAFARGVPFHDDRTLVILRRSA